MMESITLTAPNIDRLLRFFGRGHLNPSIPTERLVLAMEPLFSALEPLAFLEDNDEVKSIWLKIPRGTIEDYDSYETLHEYGEVETYEEYEELWKSDYPEPYCWYRLVIVHSLNKDGSLRFRAVGIDNKTVISAFMDNGLSETVLFTEDAAVCLCELLTQAAKAAVDKLKSGVYNDEVEAELPYMFRTGIIKRCELYERIPECDKRESDMLSAETLQACRERIAAGKNDEMSIGRIEKMTASDFFGACSIGYKACGFDLGDMSLVDRYFKYADGRDEGLSGRGHGLNEGPGIDFDDASAWENWYFNRTQRGGHPWEVVRGGNSTHVDLMVMHDKRTLDWKVRAGEMTAEQAAQHPYGYFFVVAGKHRPEEAVNFYVALSKAGLPVVLFDAEEILGRYDGSDYVGIVPHSVIPKYCESMFPKEYGRIIDFMHVYDEDYPLICDAIEWLPLEKARLE